MTSGVDELEAFIAAQRLSFLISSTAPGSPENLRQGLAAFRETLRPLSTLDTSSAPTEGYNPQQNDIHDSGSSVFAQAGEPISSTSTVWSCDDRIDVAPQPTKQTGLFGAGFGEVASQIRELIQMVKEVKAEVRNLNSALVACGRLEGREAGPLSSTQKRKDSEDCTSSTPNPNVQVESSSTQCLGISASPLLPSTTTSTRPIPALDLGGPLPSLVASVGSFVSPQLSMASATELRTVSPRPPSPGPHVVATPTEDISSANLSAEAVCSSKPPRPVSTNVTEVVPPEGEDHKGALSNANEKEPACHLACPVADETEDAKAMNCKTLLHSDEVQPETENAQDFENSEITGFRSKPPLTATAIEMYIVYQDEELGFQRGDEITILDFPNTPVGWMYGERVESRRGIFLGEFLYTGNTLKVAFNVDPFVCELARHVKKISDPEVKKMLNDLPSASENFEITKPDPRFPMIVVALQPYVMLLPTGIYI
ncbi:hypothetical protein FRC00_006534 [Tulasnella sp. 408]|nr:hypothetical protein FRC00_006534 [Tulasnella sp. 408]